MGEFRYEVYDPPGIATFAKKIAGLRPLAASGTLYRYQTGRGSITLPAGYDRLAEIIEVDPANHSNDIASLIRVYRGSDLIQELLVNESPNIVAEQPAVLACEGIEAVMDWAVAEAWDWDGTADHESQVPDWIYGGRNLLPSLTLGDLGSIREEWELYLSGEAYTLDVSSATAGTYTLTVEGQTTGAIQWDASHTAIANALEALSTVTTVSILQADPDVNTFTVVFEDPKDLSADMTRTDSTTGGMSITKLNDGFDTSLNPTWTMTVDGDTTTALDWDATSSEVQGSPLSGNGLEGLAGIDDVEVSGTGISSDPWTITFYAPPDPTNVSVTFAAGTFDLDKTQEGDPDPSPVTVSQAIDATRDPSLHGCYDEPPIQVVTTPLDTGADWSLLVNATCQFGGSQVIINNVQPGQLYQASIRIRPTVDGEYVLVIRDEFENFIAQSEPRHTLLTAGSFQELSITDIEIPDGVDRVIMRAAVVDFNSAAWEDHYVNWQGAEFREGQAATNTGTIMGHLLDDAQTDHAASAFARSTIDFINKSFSDTVDSGGNAWADAELSVNIPRGMTYRKVLDSVFGRLGYEWSVTPTSGTPGEWDLNIWNPDARGTDHTTADTPSLLQGQGTISGSATKSLPMGNIIISEGAQQYFSRAANSASYGAIGRREWYQADITYQSTQVEEWTDTTLARFLDVSLKPRFEIADSDRWAVPVIDYGLGDTLNVDLSDGSGKISREIAAISWRTVDDAIVWGVHTGEAQFDPIGGTGGGSASRGDGLAASGPVDEGVRRLIDVFDRQRRAAQASAFVPAPGGGAPTVVVAASDASSISKRKADFICAGTDDQALILEAYNTIDTGVFTNGRVLLTEGTFNIDVSDFLGLDFANITTSGLHLQGMGRGATVLLQVGTSSAGQVLNWGGSGVISDLTVQLVGSGTDTVHGIDVSSSDLTVIRNVGVVGIGNGNSAGIFIQGNSGTLITGCNIDANTAFGIRLNGTTYTQVLANNIWGTDTAIYLAQTFVSHVIGNLMQAPNRHGVRLNNTLDSRVVDNQIYQPGFDAADTYDGIFLEGGSDENYISGNQIWPASATTRYGINVSDSASECNVIVANQLHDPADYATDAINDLGTDTQWKYPDDPVYGDNFTDCGPVPS